MSDLGCVSTGDFVVLGCDISFAFSSCLLVRLVLQFLGEEHWLSADVLDDAGDVTVLLVDLVFRCFSPCDWDDTGPR